MCDSIKRSGARVIAWSTRRGLLVISASLYSAVVPYLNLTPGTRSGILHDEDYSAFVDSLAPLEAHLNSVIEAQRRTEEEQANVLGAIAR